MKCRKCGEEMEKMADRFGKSWFCYDCGYGLIIPHKLRGIIWSLLYSLKYFFTDFRTVMHVVKEKLRKRNETSFRSIRRII